MTDVTHTVCPIFDRVVRPRGKSFLIVANETSSGRQSFTTFFCLSVLRQFNLLSEGPDPCERDNFEENRQEVNPDSLAGVIVPIEDLVNGRVSYGVDNEVD